MRKQEFLARLEMGLQGLPPEDIAERLAFYGEMIDDRMEDGLPEEVAVVEIGAVDDVVAQIITEIPITRIVKEAVKPKRRMAAWEIVLLVLGSPVWLSLLIAAAAVVLSVYVVIWAIIVSLWAVAFALAVGAPVGIFGGVFCLVRGDVLQGVAFVGAGIACAGLAIFMFYACLAATKGAAGLTKRTALGIKSRFLRKENAK